MRAFLCLLRLWLALLCLLPTLYARPESLARRRLTKKADRSTTEHMERASSVSDKESLLTNHKWWSSKRRAREVALALQRQRPTSMQSQSPSVPYDRSAEEARIADFTSQLYAAIEAKDPEPLRELLGREIEHVMSPEGIKAMAEAIDQCPTKPKAVIKLADSILKKAIALQDRYVAYYVAVKTEIMMVNYASARQRVLDFPHFPEAAIQEFISKLREQQWAADEGPEPYPNFYADNLNFIDELRTSAPNAFSLTQMGTGDEPSLTSEAMHKLYYLVLQRRDELFRRVLEECSATLMRSDIQRIMAFVENQLFTFKGRFSKQHEDVQVLERILDHLAYHHRLFLFEMKSQANNITATDAHVMHLYRKLYCNEPISDVKLGSIVLHLADWADLLTIAERRAFIVRHDTTLPVYQRSVAQQTSKTNVEKIRHHFVGEILLNDLAMAAIRETPSKEDTHFDWEMDVLERYKLTPLRVFDANQLGRDY